MKNNLPEEMIKMMPIGWALHYFVKDEEGKPCDFIFVDVNPAFEQLTGLRSVDILGKKATEVLPLVLENLFDWIKTYAKVAYNNEKIELEQYFYSLDKWYKVSAYSPKNEYFVTFVEDISEKKILNSINTRQIKHNSIYNQIPALICEFDKDSRLRFVNDSYCKYFDCKKEYLLGKLFLDLIPEEDREAAKQKYLSLTSENPVITNEHRVIKGDEVRWMEWKDTAIFDEKDNAQSYFSIGNDITERKNMQEFEKRELDKLNLIFNSHPAMILYIEPDTGEIIDANPAAIEFYGYSKQELVNMSIQDINMLCICQLKSGPRIS